MNKYFGTDGIRGVFGKDLTTELAFRAGRAIVKKFGKGRYVVARDSRVSGETLQDSLLKGIGVEGGVAVVVGILPTPACAVITKHLSARCGVVLSASHNPPEYNGIKLFDSTGLKLSEEKEGEIEVVMDALIDREAKLGRIELMQDARDYYINYLAAACPKPLTGITVRLDCCYGATSNVAPLVFQHLGAKVYAYNNDYNGNKINVGVGALHPDFLLSQMRGDNEIGFSFDGDGDRLVIIMGKQIIDGDTVLYNLAHAMPLNKNTVVGTVLNNLALEEALAADGIDLVRVNVGDKYISNKMTEEGYSLGGEQSGHFIINTFCATGDAILSSLFFLNAMLDGGVVRPVKPLTLVPQEAISLRADKAIISGEGMRELVREAKKQLEGKGRIIVRMSGTEPKVRVMVECRDRDLLTELLKKLEDYIVSCKS